MSKLSSMIALASRVTVYVPGTTAVSHAASNAAQVKATAELMARLYGGATSSAAVGYWVSEAAGLVKEKTVMVFAYCNQEALENTIDTLVEHCIAMKQAMGQEAIALEVNGAMYLV